ncbi:MULTISPECIES: low molecular weight protein-tyrosine-phosphatase [Leeuwenhoekiella]|uniref:protein-tyrosine-phosphatase n=1 Tax=Leeuwenhoekiella blandensis (strain CECT 7118 / CCUG 51940 / KCTC 22103 / MED217) TaxID=398720 RepID=A3XM92_LEEBM|nr:MULTISPECIES: low molecular weight protein-tyrosine-phosphatase [Leeuwenhoekiella]EAQ49333.1 protein tyrosine phosphatase [Leeuwenhoekiella blandensis MED217]MAO43001.1 low molecular weight phosphotyrosine protein phosphatase [Leeuwenhoekiella sp.]HBT09421.1 low molecular weight phosphotyrosine protein phosphatase [Leeuwenhoekiella sp.]|tara:strand:+ start:731 stop:1186 length:456 start_codon:yes stop_codon:yes gene_type:complete
MKTHILMVCLGNICRSPLAEGLLKSKLDAERFQVDSAGTGHWHVGSMPDSRSIAVAQKNGLDITDQRGMQFKPAFFDRYDHIFVMDNYNYEDVVAQATKDEDKAKVQLILDEIFPGERVDVPDPYNDSLRGFDRVYEMLDEATTKIAERLS